MSVRLLVGDCRETLATLEAGSVQVCINSPPFYQLRAYDGPPVIFGGDPNCSHSWGQELPGKRSRWGDLSSLSEKQTSNGGSAAMVAALEAKAGSVCEKCSAWLGFLGLEPRVELYVEHLVEVYQSVRRVLHETGTLWVNLGDSYNSSGGHSQIENDGRANRAERSKMKGSNVPGLAAGNLIGVPWRVAYALQADGWILRSAITCTKVAPMPESCQGVRWQRHQVKVGPQRRSPPGSYKHECDPSGKAHGAVGKDPISGETCFDSRAQWENCPGCAKCEKNGGYVLRWGSGRPTSSYEMLFLFAKSDRYYFDSEAVRADSTPSMLRRAANGHTRGANGKLDGSRQDHNTLRGEGAKEIAAAGRNAWNYQRFEDASDVWEWRPSPFSEAHFACVDEATECLTQRGWAKHTDLVLGEMIASYDMEAQTLGWRPLLEVASYQHSGEMIAARCASLDMLLTKNHRCVVQRRFHPRGAATYFPKPFIKEASDLRVDDNIPTASAWEDGGEKIDPLWAELLGWYIAEGHECKSGLSVEIYQSLTANPKKVERLCCILDQIDADWSIAHCTRMFRGKDSIQSAIKVRGYTAAQLRSWSPRKMLATDVLSWSRDSLTALMAGLIGGDGHTRKDDGRACFVQKDTATVDLVQAIAVRLGWSTCVRFRQGIKMWTIYFTKHDRRAFRGTNGKGENAGIEVVPYEGIVWCPRTPDGTWVARRNGTVFVTGNTFPVSLPTWCIKAATPEAGCCSACGMPYARVVEREFTPESPNSVMYADKGQTNGNRWAGTPRGSTTARSLGHRPTCACNAPSRPALVLDPFAGAGTTGLAADRLGRDAVLIELSEAYAKMARERLKADAGLFADLI